MIRVAAALCLCIFSACLTPEETDETTLSLEPEDLDDMPRSGIPPWHMWGGAVTVDKPSTLNLSAASIDTQQLVRIEYKRPDTWNWLFMVELLDAAEVPENGTALVQVSFDLTVGIGRTVTTLRGFERFAYTWGDPAVFPNATNFPNKQQIWSTQSYSAQRVQHPVASLDLPNLTTEITAQDIQLQARIIYVRNAIAGDDTAKVAISAHFAPKTHVRPEWYKGEFPGAEDGGGTSAAQQVKQLSRAR